jgi:galactose oxidase
MASLGNAWHIPVSAEPYRRGGMRDPVGAVVPGAAIEIFVGNQFQGAGTAGKLHEVDCVVHFRYKRPAGGWTDWRLVSLWCSSRGQANGECDVTGPCISTSKEHGVCAASGIGTVRTNDCEYFVAKIPADTFEAGDVVEYCIGLAYEGGSMIGNTWLRAAGEGSETTDSWDKAAAQPFTFTVDPNATRGRWSAVFELRNVGIHTHVLPNGHVLMWGRRDRPKQTINTHECTPFVWDPSNPGVDIPTPKPTLANGKTKVNLFCSGHTFLPDGRLLVVGGHLFDGEGIQQATIYDCTKNTWTATSLMNDGRWYPSATSLPDGDVLVASGSVAEEHSMNAIPQVWRNGTWIEINGPIDTGPTLPQNQSLELYPRIHVLSSGLLCMTGSLRATWTLDISKDNGTWTRIGGEGRHEGRRDYCPSVIYDVDKVIYIGGGNAPAAEGYVPTAKAERIDLAQAAPQWEPAGDMSFPRRHHNATILPDGTVLVTGGTRGGGGPGDGFNDLTRGQPVHVAELWDPKTGDWTQLAAEQVDRCYHATAVLLPDATVLSAGSGEYAPWEGLADENFAEDNHRNAQIFSPPYLFQGDRPEISNAPHAVSCAEQFTVQTAQAAKIGTVSLVRLSSVTHALNMNQRINFLEFEASDGELLVTAPQSPNACPPGHYMLFILSEGVPSVAKIIRVKVSPTRHDTYADGAQMLSASAVAEDVTFMTSVAQREAVLAADKGTRVVVGLTGRCPYGIGACWGGAEEALRGLKGVKYVDPIPDVGNSTAVVFLQDDRLPALTAWHDEFPRIANGSYDLRHVEVSLQGEIEARDGELVLKTQDQSVQLGALAQAEKVQWDAAAGAPRVLQRDEATAYDELAANTGHASGQRATVTGPLEQMADGYVLHVRQFSV